MPKGKGLSMKQKHHGNMNIENTQGTAQKHSHYTPEEQIASQQIDIERRRLLMLHKYQRNMHLIL